MTAKEMIHVCKEAKRHMDHVKNWSTHGPSDICTSELADQLGQVIEELQQAADPWATKEEAAKWPEGTSAVIAWKYPEGMSIGCQLEAVEHLRLELLDPKQTFDFQRIELPEDKP